MNDIIDTWVYLKTLPLFYLSLTLVAFLLAQLLQRAIGRTPILNPVMISVPLIIAVLVASDTTYEQYFDGAKFIHFLLGPATILLAVPIYQNIHHIRRFVISALISVLAGSASAALSAVLIIKGFSGSPELMASIAPKSVTAPIAMGLSEALGGLPSLTAGLVVLTGIVGAALGPFLLNVIGIKNWAARGLAVGTASHGIGTARAYESHPEAGTYAGFAFGANALLTALLLPIFAAAFAA